MNHINTRKRPRMSPFPSHALSVIHKRQTGASLIVSLMLLVVLPLLGLSGMQSTIMQERMSSNVRDKGLAFQAAESALRGGEDWVQSQPISKLTAPGGSCSAPCNLVRLDYYNNMSTRDFSWWETTGRTYTDMPGGIVASAPRFIVEEHSTRPDSLTTGTDYSTAPVRSLFRLTAMGVGGTITAESMIQTLYARID